MKKLDLTGQRFGKITVLRPAENIGDCTAWVCRCDCGQETVVRTDKLRRGRTKSCGCQREISAALARRNLIFVDGTCVNRVRSKCVWKNNTSGVPGVDWWSARQRWRAAITFKKKRYYLGAYYNFEDAVKARKRAEENLHESFLRDYAAQIQSAND